MDNKSSTLQTLTEKVKMIGEGVSRAQQSVGTTLETGKAVVKKARTKIYQLITQTTQTAGKGTAIITSSRILRRMTKVLHLNWLLGAVDQVDVSSSEAYVRKLQQQHPHDTPSQIAHRLMVEKSIHAGGVGLVTSLVPGEAIALIAIDLATTTRLQAEMVYQIAAAYGLDVNDSDRKGEVLAIFGLALGGTRAIRVGLDLFRNVPVAGAVIGASANATILYSLGYAACRFYEAKLNASTADIEKIAAVKEASDSYLEIAVAQQAVMDQILAHMLLATYPEKTWTEILPDLQRLKLSPASMKALTSIKSPQPLNMLLDQLNRDFAVPLLAQCYRIAQLDHAPNTKQMQIMTAIANRFDIDLNSIQSALQAKPIAASSSHA
ncbi:MAG: hypothetical protein JOZ78_04335 [Chroococcidiopsidaceae cyanobacterium CP_BM_ER_R8_30]|nr:hypothetical protein [Chroococcidiopsidaceae cyanobacterium CP_BM_ER_R8_30]